ncbi:alkyl/aryl-sulfatase [Glaciecola sp. HTCC2999]|uniref:alkyl/aryl-sulfatase n=1 Tax=Glaciecola sp. HTCC2999 TaxID=455436 RepID=UPI0012EABE1A|nr:alkyl sulfatase dimerization domain-containing protein [Glaciecola sp. HTCC2999]
MNFSRLSFVFICGFYLLHIHNVAAEVAEKRSSAKPASSHTITKQNEVKQALPFANKKDFALAEKGLIVRPEQVEIFNDDGTLAWELGNYQFLLEDHASVNPSLLRQARLNYQYGLFKITENIYQVRGYDLSNFTVIKGDTGWIVFDPLLTPATAKAALKLVNDTLGQRPVTGVVYSHAHADHFGGVLGVVTPEQVKQHNIPIIAPSGFMEHAIKENVLAGNVMTRRAIFQYGNVLPKGATGQVDAAIGKGLSIGMFGLIKPTVEIDENERVMIIDGVEMVFINTPGGESPAEMNTYFPKDKAFWAAENVIGTMHNVYTLRGAAARDALAWSKFINEMVYGYGQQAEIIFASHSWPRWGNEDIQTYLKKQRDMYAYLHNETLHLANQGVTINEIHNEINVPDSLQHEWYNRGYHGSYKHNAQGIMNKYLGYFDMNPANLDRLSPADSAPKYVAAMGGEKQVMTLAQEAHDKGEYRWGAELLNKLVFAQPNYIPAKRLLANIYEQMGYQAESAGWRNTYLTGAKELRDGVLPTSNITRPGPSFLQAMDTGLLFDYLAVKVNAKRAESEAFKINFTFTDEGREYLVELSNATLTNIEGVTVQDADLSLTISREDWTLVILKQVALRDLLASGKASFAGDIRILNQLFSLLDEFPFWFNIVTP